MIGTENEMQRSEQGRLRLRRVALLCAVILSAAFCAGTLAITSWDHFGPPSWRPRIAGEHLIFDFGERRVGETVHHEFTLSNVGGEELVITKATATCGCVTPLISEARIPPGYAIQLPVQISLDRADEKMQKQLFIESNDPVRGKLVLSIVGRVVAN